MIPAKVGEREMENELALAFQRFEQASGKLEGKYQDLLRETERLRAQLKDKEEEVRRSERLASLGETAAALAHEVRNPLGAMKLFLSLLKDEIKDNGAALELLSHLDRSALALDNVVSNILQFARTQAPTRAPLNLHAIIHEQVLHVRALPGFEAEVKLSLAANPYLQGNEHGLRQVIYNILLNACQATKFHGVIVIESFDFEDGVCLRLSDNGPGINEAQSVRIFDPFFTTKNEGTGLGLAVVKQIVTQHGGTISVSNNGGAIFEVFLPRSAPLKPQTFEKPMER